MAFDRHVPALEISEVKVLSSVTGSYVPKENQSFIHSFKQSTKHLLGTMPGTGNLVSVSMDPII